MQTNNITLSNLFQTDFSNLLRVHKDIECNVHDEASKRLVKTTVTYKIYKDFSANNEFMGFYVPHSPESYALAKVFLNSYEGIVKSIKEDLKVNAKAPGDSDGTDAENLSFSGRVYIYHEDNFSLQQKAELETLYKEHGLSVIFRGHEYLMLKIWQPSNSNKKGDDIKETPASNSHSLTNKQRRDGLEAYRAKIIHDIFAGSVINTAEDYTYYYDLFSKYRSEAAQFAKDNDFEDYQRLEALGVIPLIKGDGSGSDHIKSMAKKAIEVIEHIINIDKNNTDESDKTKKELDDHYQETAVYPDDCFRCISSGIIKLHRLAALVCDISPPGNMGEHPYYKKDLLNSKTNIGLAFDKLRVGACIAKEIEITDKGTNYPFGCFIKVNEGIEWLEKEKFPVSPKFKEYLSKDILSVAKDDKLSGNIDINTLQSFLLSHTKAKRTPQREFVKIGAKQYIDNNTIDFHLIWDELKESENVEKKNNFGKSLTFKDGSSCDKPNLQKKIWLRLKEVINDPHLKMRVYLSA